MFTFLVVALGFYVALDQEAAQPKASLSQGVALAHIYQSLQIKQDYLPIEVFFFSFIFFI